MNQIDFSARLMRTLHILKREFFRVRAKRRGRTSKRAVVKCGKLIGNSPLDSTQQRRLTVRDWRDAIARD
ncbi:hypothetical protein [Paraburkholderia aromaticivorans]|uniref:hypothetical protein n=1 Tax=Paraburkholderia aromaticivorans TaxID=2026199 RepID=UPI001456053D|nr:hypothetical protein [Paraburkholderia aromaticivorans]